jgi:hypothetical protein
MTTESPDPSGSDAPDAAATGSDAPATPEPPVVEERRRMPDRRQGERRAEDRSRYLRTAAAAAIAICGGLSVVYLFFAAFGAIDLEEALGATVVAVVMGLVWLGGYFVRHRQATRPESRVTARREQERRGF